MDGDLAIDRTGDVRDTSYDPLRSTFQEVRTRAQSSFRDWATQPSIGANLEGLLAVRIIGLQLKKDEIV